MCKENNKRGLCIYSCNAGHWGLNSPAFLIILRHIPVHNIEAHILLNRRFKARRCLYRILMDYPLSDDAKPRLADDFEVQEFYETR